MSSFTPVNRIEETEDDIDEHIREVKLEEALKHYQKTLRLHAAGSLDEALHGYEALLASEIVQDLIEDGPDEEPVGDEDDVFGGDAIAGSRLPYLAFKNYGTALLQSTRRDLPHLLSPPELLYAKLLHVLQEYAAALSFDPSDRRLWQTVHSLATYLSLDKAVRATLENELDAVKANEVRSFFVDEDRDAELQPVLAGLRTVCSRLGDESGLAILPAIEVNGENGPPHRDTLSWLPKHFPPVPVSSAPALHTSSIDLDHLSWYRFGRSLLEGQRILRRTMPPQPCCIIVDVPAKSSSGSAVPTSPDSKSHHSRADSPANLNGSPRRDRKEARANGLGTRSPTTKRGVDSTDTEDSGLRASKRQRRNSVDARIAHDTENPSQLLEAVNDRLTSVDVKCDDFSAVFRNVVLHDADAHGAFDAVQNVLSSMLLHEWSDDLCARAQAQTDDATQHATQTIERNMMLNFASTDTSLPSVSMSDADLEHLRRTLAGKPTHNTHVSAVYLQTILGGAHETPSYLTMAWPAQLKDLVTDLIHVEQDSLMRLADSLTEHSATAQFQSVLSVLQAAVELLIDEAIIEARKDEDQSPTPALSRAEAWQRKVDDLHRLQQDRPAASSTDTLDALLLRHRWSCIVAGQLSGLDSDCVLRQYQELESQSSDLLATVRIAMPNTTFISTLSGERLLIEISKFRTGDFFATVFHADAEGNHAAVVKELRPVLLDAQKDKDSNRALIQKYVADAPWRFSLRIWTMLMDALITTDQDALAVTTAYEILKILLRAISADQAASLDVAQRKDLLLFVIHQILRTLPVIYTRREVSSNESDTNNDTLRDRLSVIVSLASFSVIFFHDEDLRAERDDHGSKDSSLFARFRDNLQHFSLQVWVVFYKLTATLTLSCLPTQQANEELGNLLYVLHDELGSRGFCALADGAFLKLCEDEIYRINSADNEHDLIQVLHCRYGISFESGAFYPWDHATEPSSISAKEACRILPFLTTFVPQRADGLIMPKQDLRNALELVHEALQEELKQDPVYATNGAVLEDFFAADLTREAIAAAVVGQLTLPLRQVGFKDVDDAAAGPARELARTIGRAYLGQLKSRAKLATPNARALEDISEASAYFELDIQLNPAKHESWIQLARLYATSAEENLSTTCEYIVSLQEDIVGFQRRALLCYLMAISNTLNIIQADETKPHIERELADLHFELGVFLVDVVECPLSMAAFDREDLVFAQDGQNDPGSRTKSAATERELLRLAYTCLRRANMRCTEIWQCHMHLGKVGRRLGVEPSKVLAYMRRAAENAPTKPIGDGMLVLEPHYNHVSAIHAYLRNGCLTESEARQRLANLPAYGSVPEDDQTALDLLQKALQNMRNADKKHWHHRPTYRLSTLHLERSIAAPDLIVAKRELQLARETFESLMTQKGPVTSVLTIWRTAFERPGKHFIYMEKYSLYYMDLLLRARNPQAGAAAAGEEGADAVDCIRSFLRRIRRDTSNIWDHKEVWDESFDRYLDYIAEQEQIESGLHLELENIIMLEDFKQAATRLDNAALLPTFARSTLLKTMRDLYDMRKVNGGLSETNEADNLILDMYVTMYMWVQDQTDFQLGLVKAPPAEEEIKIEATITAPTASPGPPAVTGANDTVTADDTPVTPAAAPSSRSARSRLREAKLKLAKVARKDMLARAFALCKPKGSANEVSGSNNPVAAPNSSARMSARLRADSGLGNEAIQPSTADTEKEETARDNDKTTATSAASQNAHGLLPAAELHAGELSRLQSDEADVQMEDMPASPKYSDAQTPAPQTITEPQSPQAPTAAAVSEAFTAAADP
ncbi:Histone transcription regulator 3 [Savitreella phatthalungensis]